MCSLRWCLLFIYKFSLVLLFCSFWSIFEASAQIIKERGKVYWQEDGRTVSYLYDSQLNLIDKASKSASVYATFAKNEKFVALSKTGLLKVFHRSGPLVLNYRADKFSVTALEFLPDNCSILAGLADGSVLRIYFCARDKDRQVERYANHWSMVTSLWSHPTQKFFISGDVTGNTVVSKLYDSDYHGGARDIDLMKGHEFVESERKITLSRAYSSEVVKIVGNEFVVVGLKEGVLEIFDLRGKRKLRDVKAHSGLLDILYDSNNEIFITLGDDHRVRFWRVILVNGGIHVSRDPRLVALAEIKVASYTLKGHSRIFGVISSEKREAFIPSNVESECKVRNIAFSDFLRNHLILLVNVAVRKEQKIESLEPRNVGASNDQMSTAALFSGNCTLAGQSMIPAYRFLGYTELDPEESRPPKKVRKSTGKAQ